MFCKKHNFIRTRKIFGARNHFNQLIINRMTHRKNTLLGKSLPDYSVRNRFFFVGFSAGSNAPYFTDDFFFQLKKVFRFLPASKFFSE